MESEETNKPPGETIPLNKLKAKKMVFNSVVKVKENEATVESFSAKDFIYWQLQIMRLQITGESKKVSPKVKANIQLIDRSIVFVNEKIDTLSIYKVEPDKKGIQYNYSYLKGSNYIEGENDELLLTKGYPIPYIVTMLLYPETATAQKINIGKFRRAGHLTDQILKYNYPKDKSPQLSIFDSLQEGTKRDIEGAGVKVTEIVEGIKLSPSETKVIDCLCKLLHETSETLDDKKESYYSGNIGYELVEYGGDKKTPAPKLAFTLYELTREYKGGEYVAGKDIENIKQILTDLDNKKFLLSYVETTKKKDGGRIERKIEDFRKLIHIVKISQTEYSKEDVELSKKEETVILLNPIFRRQIDSKFILYPNDINRRTIIAYGSHNIADTALRLRDYLIRELSSKRYQPEISLDKLYYMLAEKWMRESRKKKVKDYTERALETVKALGLLLSHEIKTSSTGEPKVVFQLNKDWE
jgi:hypothetical protein